ncbi:MAG: hypothetical protein QOI80_3359 [Solirubrobacteraceae bacterium]|nr:hypothetical protein [Solirubrobacteraceae bacterium]
MTKPLDRPGGAPPPSQATLPDGSALALVPLASEITDRYAHAFPDEQDRYTPEWREWCTHDNQHVLAWALDAQAGLTDLWEQISWLARVLEARDYPLDRLARSLELGGDVLDERVGAATAEAAKELRAVAVKVA